MRTVDDLMKDAWASLLRGDRDERDRLCGLARNVLNAQNRIRDGGKIAVGEPINYPSQATIPLPDRSHETIN